MSHQQALLVRCDTCVCKERAERGACDILCIPIGCRIVFLAVAEQIVGFDEEAIEHGGGLNNFPGHVVQSPFRFVERTHTDAVGAITGVLCPEAETFLAVHVPLERTVGIRCVQRFLAPFASADSIGGAVVGAFAADFAEFLHAELDRRLVWNEGCVCRYPTQPHAFEHVVFRVTCLGIAGHILGLIYTARTPQAQCSDPGVMPDRPGAYRKAMNRQESGSHYAVCSDRIMMVKTREDVSSLAIGSRRP